jgi:hypothetical protein
MAFNGISIEAAILFLKKQFLTTILDLFAILILKQIFNVFLLLTINSSKKHVVGFRF